MDEQWALGAVMHAGGVHFKVWAPFAESVAVMGDFNNWSHDATPLTKDENGNWQVDVPDAQVGQEYRYVIKHDGQELLRSDPRSLQLSEAGDNSVIVDPKFNFEGDNFELASPKQLLIYELHVGTFARDDPAMAGRFSDTINKLDYLAELGVNAIEVMPIMAVYEGKGWGYMPCNIYAIEAAYGGRHGFLELVKAAHEHSIGIILDVVYNHMATEGLDLWQFDGWSQNDMGGIYFYNDERGKTPWGATRFDAGRPEVRQYITDNVRMLVDDYRVDALRVDSTLYIRKTASGPVDDSTPDSPDGWKILQEIVKAAKQAKRPAFVIGEDLQGNQWITKPQAEGGAGFDAQWDPSFCTQIRDVLDPPADESRDMEKIRNILNTRYNNSPWQRIIYTESHDNDANGRSRLDEEIAPGDATDLFARKRSTLGAGLMLTAPGTPMLFQGQEFMETGFFTHWRPIDWQKNHQFEGILTLYRHLINLRHNKYDNSQGLRGDNIDVFCVDNIKKIVAYHRWDKGGVGDDVVVVANFSNNHLKDYQIALPREGTWRVRFNSDWKGYSEDFGGVEQIEVNGIKNNQGIIGQIDVGAYSLIVLSQDS